MAGRTIPSILYCKACQVATTIPRPHTSSLLPAEQSENQGTNPTDVLQNTT
jgi:hypothetical protein